MLIFLTVAFAAQPSKRPADHIVGKEIYDKSCWQCHGADLSGNGPAGEALGIDVPDLRGQLDYEAMDPLVDTIQHGTGDMPAFSTELDRPTTRRVLVYLKRLEDGKEDPTEHKAPEEPIDDEIEGEVEETPQDGPLDEPEVEEPTKRLPI
ncbi:MAG: cytochrome c [Proteobacteria bacterium]|nr:cytochrome c [Pseudomonadota bacterium]MCP4920708.1 cytochrome c [Pseudomonadota bacterium]